MIIDQFKHVHGMQPSLYVLYPFYDALFPSTIIIACACFSWNWMGNNNNKTLDWSKGWKEMALVGLAWTSQTKVGRNSYNKLFDLMNKSLTIKLNWRFMTKPSSLWIKSLRYKYLFNSYPKDILKHKKTMNEFWFITTWLKVNL